ncbi:MAG: shikimate kinase [Bacteroidaceae bacterium]|nr:shikimate kinase [Bacteroidaceae bacterium]
MKNLILIGYMCAGKSTVGKSLGKRLGRQFYDLDWYIEERYRKRISDIFAEKGEDGFRQIEYKMLHEVAEFEDIVLSCGGGTPCFYDNMDYLNRIGTTIFLNASPDTIVEHLKISRTVRPLLQGKSGEELRSYIAGQLQGRMRFYEQAQYIFDVNILDGYDKIDLLITQILETIKDKT